MARLPLKFLSIALAGCACVTLSPNAAMAQPPSQAASNNGWRLEKFTYAKKDETTGDGRVLYTENTTSRGVLFHCKENTLQVMLSVEPVAIFEVLGDIGFSRLLWTTVQIGGKDAFTENWVLLRRNKVAVPRNKYTARKIFNASANDLPVTISIGKYDNLEIDPPAPAPALFNEFVTACALAG